MEVPLKVQLNMKLQGHVHHQNISKSTNKVFNISVAFLAQKIVCEILWYGIKAMPRIFVHTWVGYGPRGSEPEAEWWQSLVREDPPTFVRKKHGDFGTIGRMHMVKKDAIVKTLKATCHLHKEKGKKCLCWANVYPLEGERHDSAVAKLKTDMMAWLARGMELSLDEHTSAAYEIMNRQKALAPRAKAKSQAKCRMRNTAMDDSIGGS